MAQYTLTETPGECKPVALSFGDIQFSTIDRDGEPWFRSGEIARALKYSSEKSITNLYARNADEFSNDMTVVITLMTNDGVAAETRIFSLRGCHLLAMFARTPVAKAFRKWVLDVLDKLAAEERARLSGDVKQLSADTLTEASTTLTKSTVDDREPIRQIVDTWAELAEKPHFLLYRQLRAAFQLKNIKELPAEWVADAVAWVQERIDSLQRALPPSPLPVAKGPAPAPTPLIDEAAMTEPALWDEKLQFFSYICEEGYRGIHTYRRMVMEQGTKLYRGWLDHVFPGTANRERRVELAAVYHHSLRDMVDRMCCCGDELTPEHNPATALSTFTRAVGLLSNGRRA